MQGRKRNVQSLELAAAAAASIAMVFLNDGLLLEILLRVGSPTWLVRAALVCKHWHVLASDPAFLRRFRALHPPRVLGLSVHDIGGTTRLLPVPQPPDLATAAGLASRTVGTLGRYNRVTDFRNGRLLLEIYSTRNTMRYVVRSLLRAATPETTLLRPPLLCRRSFSVLPGGPGVFHTHRLFLLEDHVDATSCLSLTMECDADKVCASFCIPQAGVWSDPQTTVMELQQDPNHTVLGHKLLQGSKVYMMTTAGCILVLDLATASFSIVDLPDEARESASLKFSRGQNSRLDATEFQLRVWHGDGMGHWGLVDTIPVIEPCAHLNVQQWEPDDDQGTAPVRIVGVGDNAEFTMLELVASGIVCCMQLSNRVVEKMAEGVLQHYGASARPITMVWPPVTPALD